ncbi:hypothetical protein [Streptomyces sp. NPDC094031]|uniref:hypothetical protein n=1 Tax=Streptomyces sp. NPDC094031 TaxID=3155307 RepID=UPI00331E1C51
MGPEQVQEQVQDLCTETLAKGADITSAERWADNSRPSGLVITFSSGARLWTGVTTANAESFASTASAAVAPSDAPPPPALFDSAGKITPIRAEQYLAAVLTAARAPEITSAYSYSSTAPRRHPGIGIHLADGTRAFLPFVYTAAHGKKPAARAFTIDAAF